MKNSKLQNFEWQLFCVCFSENTYNKLIYTVAPSSNKGLDFWRHIYTVSLGWQILKQQLPSASWLSVLLHFSKRVTVFISYLKSHLFFNHVVNRTGHFPPHFHFYTSQPTIDLNLHSQKLSEHHHDTIRGKFHTLTSFGRLRYKCSSTVIQKSPSGCV